MKTYALIKVDIRGEKSKEVSTKIIRGFSEANCAMQSLNREYRAEPFYFMLKEASEIKKGKDERN